MDRPVFKKRYVVYRRVAELLLPTIFSSLLITILNITGVVLNRIGIFFMVLAFVLAFTCFNFINLRKCYFDMRNKSMFFELNFLSHAIFAGINFIFLVFANNEIYTWLFSITKVLRFLYVDRIYSVLFFHFIQLFCIILSPIGMDWIFYEIEEAGQQNETETKTDTETEKA